VLNVSVDLTQVKPDNREKDRTLLISFDRAVVARVNYLVAATAQQRGVFAFLASVSKQELHAMCPFSQTIPTYLGLVSVLIWLIASSDVLHSKQRGFGSGLWLGVNGIGAVPLME